MAAGTMRRAVVTAEETAEKATLGRALIMMVLKLRREMVDLTVCAREHLPTLPFLRLSLLEMPVKLRLLGMAVRLLLA